MKIIFFGSSLFSVPIFQKLIDSECNISLCLTQPDRPKGRGLELRPTPVKEVAIYNNIELLQPENVNDTKVIDKISSFNPDIFIVASYGQILSKSLLDKARYPVGIHPSLLPKYRGPAPVNYALLNGDEITGLTIFRMNDKMDAGDIIDSKIIEIDPSENALELSNRLSRLGADLTLKVLDDIDKNQVNFIMQDEDKASYTPKLKKEFGLIDWNQPSIVIHDKIRALFPWPGTFTYYKDRSDENLVKIWEGECYSQDGPYAPGEILDVTHKGIIVGTGEGSLLIKVIQPAGKQKMSSYAFAQGWRISTKDKFL